MIRKFISLAAIALFSTAAAHAQQWYVGGSIGALVQDDSDNRGITGSFNTGNGAPAVPNGTPVAAGTPYSWTTEFDNGVSGSLEAGLRYDSGLRSGIELTYGKADVDTHSGVRLGGTLIDGVDAAVLTGSSTPLGATVGQVVADGRGDIATTALFANLYYEFNRAGAWQPYLGVGIGVAKVDVNYAPSGVRIIDGDDTKFAWQAKAGLTWRVNPDWDVYGEYAYRRTDDVSLDNKLFPGSLDIENAQSVVSLGVRYRL